MARLTDYRRVIFNKHVLSFDLMARDVYRELERLGKVPGPEDVEQMVKSRDTQWLRFNDHFLFERISEFSTSSEGDPWSRTKAQQLVRGQPALVVVSEERFCTKKEWREFVNTPSVIPKDEDLEELAKKASVPVQALAVAAEDVAVIEERGKNPIHIRTDNGFVDILDLPESYVSRLQRTSAFIMRLYAIDEETKAKVEAVLD